jgi:hypothetical protein
VSKEVALDDLAVTIGDYDFAYVPTVSDDQRPHLVAIRPVVLESGELEVPVGRTTIANAAARPQITLVFPPVEDGGFSLVVDALASGDGSGSLRLRPTWAVLHRPAP